MNSDFVEYLFATEILEIAIDTIKCKVEVGFRYEGDFIYAYAPVFDERRYGADIDEAREMIKEILRSHLLDMVEHIQYNTGLLEIIKR